MSCSLSVAHMRTSKILAQTSLYLRLASSGLMGLVTPIVLKPNGSQLQHIAQYLAEGKVRIFAAKVLPLQAAR